MSANYKEIPWDRPMLFSPDMRDWVPEDDMVHFVLEAVELVPTDSFHHNHSGTGSPQFPPRMMLALLIYSYANGIFSSRRIQRATYRDIAVRYITGNTHPDHATICRFRHRNFEAVSQAFLEVLKLAREMKLLKVGNVSIDGTHVKASASIYKSIRYDRICELDQKLTDDIAELMRKAEESDNQSEDDGQKLPDEIKHRRYRLSDDDLVRDVLNTNEATGKNYRAFQLATGKLLRNPSIARQLIHKSGPLDGDLAQMDEYADLYLRGMQEVASFLEGITTEPL